MKLSVIIPVYNAERYIANCLESLYGQNLKEADFELILVNDGSTDSSGTIVKEFQEAHSNIRLINQQNKGQGAARNMAIAMAKGTYIYFLDADDYLAAGTLGPMLELAAEQDLEVLGFKTRVTASYDLKMSEEKDIAGEIKVLSGREFMTQAPSHRYEVWWYFLNRKFLLSSGIQFEEGKYLEDALFTLKILLQARRFAFVPIDVHRYVKLESSTMNSDDPDHLIKIVADYETLVHRLTDLMESCKQEYHSTALDNHLHYVRTVTIYFMFFKIIRSRLGVKPINRILSGFRSTGAYPFSGLIGSQFNHQKIKISAFVFNRRLLFLSLLFPLRFAVKNKMLKLPM